MTTNEILDIMSRESLSIMESTYPFEAYFDYQTKRKEIVYHKGMFLIAELRHVSTFPKTNYGFARQVAKLIREWSNQ